MRINNVRFLVLMAFLSTMFQCFGMCEMTFFDIGQGNCSLVSCDKKGIVLVDCGTSAYTAKGDDFKEVQVKNIAEKIIALLRNDDSQQLFLVISHPDKDHYNCLVDVLKRCQSRLKGRLRIAQIYLGGAEKYYEKKCIQYLRTLKAEIFFPAELKPTGEIVDLFSSGGTYCLLPALSCEKKSSSNDASLVIRIKFGDKSCILTGDATEKTTKHIVQNCLRLGYDLSTDIVQASHHGAADDCNSSEWIAALKPEHVVFSAGFHEGYLHPRTHIVDRQQAHTGTTQYHVLYTGVKKRSDDIRVMPIYAINAEAYGVISTANKVYSTLNQGTITFKWREEDRASLVPDCSTGEFYASEKECVLRSLAHPPVAAKFFAPINMKSINLSCLGIDDEEKLDGELLAILLAVFADEKSSLKKFFLDNNRLRNPRTLELISDIIKRPQMRVFQAESCDIPGSEKDKLLALWGNRGFKV